MARRKRRGENGKAKTAEAISTSRDLMNIMELYESKEMPSKNSNILPNVFVILALSEPLIFRYEFMDGLLKQEYPKERNQDRSWPTPFPARLH